MIRVFIADDHSIVRAGIRHILGLAPDIQVVGEAADGLRVIEQIARAEMPLDVLILDLSLPGLHGLEVLRRALQVRPGLAVLILSMYAEEQYARRVVDAGAAGFLSKDRSDVDLLDAVRAVAQGRVFLSRSASQRVGAAAKAPHETLTAREVQVFMLLIEGRAVGEIAVELGLGISTVSTHLGKIRTKLGVQTIAEIVSYAHRAGLCD